MLNTKTTVIGYMVLLSVLLKLVTSLASGDVDMTALADVSAGLAGIGLIVAKDGSH